MSLKDVIFTMSRHLIETCESSEDLRLKKTALTRKRRLGAKNLLRILLRRLVASPRSGIGAYYDLLKEDPVSKQAFPRRGPIWILKQFWHILLEPNDALRTRMLERLCLDIASRPESIRPGRSPLHKSPRAKRFPMAWKAVLP